MKAQKSHEGRGRAGPLFAINTLAARRLGFGGLGFGHETPSTTAAAAAAAVVAFLKGITSSSSRMPRVDADLKLDFKDVLFRPKRSSLKSRSEVTLSPLRAGSRHTPKKAKSTFIMQHVVDIFIAEWCGVVVVVVV